jgi:hypothetical protein
MKPVDASKGADPPGSKERGPWRGRHSRATTVESRNSSAAGSQRISKLPARLAQGSRP